METKFQIFERCAVGITAVSVGMCLAAFSVMGPLWLELIQYKTSPSAIYQLIGQDLVNLLFLSPLCVVGGVLRLTGNPRAKYFLIMTPLYLIYTALSYGMGMEWSHTAYTGNSEQFFFLYLWTLIGAFILLFDSLARFSNYQSGKNISKRLLTPYTIVFGLFLLMFAMMWLAEVGELINTGTSRGYEASPVAFWVVRYFDLGFTIPLGFISIYLLWSRPRTSFPVQMLFYGFFITMGLAVNVMGLVMLFMGDPDWTLAGTMVFAGLLVIIAGGFFMVVKYGREKIADGTS